jgi:hypothetical protein
MHRWRSPIQESHSGENMMMSPRGMGLFPGAGGIVSEEDPQQVFRAPSLQRVSPYILLEREGRLARVFHRRSGQAR